MFKRQRSIGCSLLPLTTTCLRPLRNKQVLIVATETLFNRSRCDGLSVEDILAAGYRDHNGMAISVSIRE